MFVASVYGGGGSWSAGETSLFYGPSVFGHGGKENPSEEGKENPSEEGKENPSERVRR